MLESILTSVDYTAKVHHTAVIGSEGFGFQRVRDEQFVYPLKRNPHKFKVIINSWVEIGPLCVIDRGSWRETIIGSHTKLDSCVKVAHNVQIGKNNLLVHGTVIGGSCTIGDNNFFGINCSVKQHLTIGSNCVIGMGAVVIHDVPDNTTVYGNPARPPKFVFQGNYEDVKKMFKNKRLDTKWLIHNEKGFPE
jgi:UDP-3-O-[3-hydroxymyristoyl] glucosamine N-acyltransferase LpxD